MRALALLLVLAGTAHATEDWGTPVVELATTEGTSDDPSWVERV